MEWEKFLRHRSKILHWASLIVGILVITANVCYAACPITTVQCDPKICEISNFRGIWEDGRRCKATKVVHSRSECEITNFRGIWEDGRRCQVTKVVYPRSEEELLRAVADAVKQGLNIKVMTTGSYTINRFGCPGRDGVAINTRDYNSGITVDKQSMRVTVDAGVQSRDLIDRLAEEGLALTHSSDWDAVTMAGVVSMAAHGSGLWGKGGAVHEYVVGMRLVVPAPPRDGYAKIITLTETDEDLKAARVSLGVLGAISRLTFAVEKIFKRSVTLDLQVESGFEESILQFARSHEFGEITWYASLHQVLYRLDDRMPVEASGNGKYFGSGFRPQTVKTVVQNRIIEEQIQENRDSGKLCQISKTQLTRRMESGGGFLNDGHKFTSFPVIGYNHVIQASSGCQKNSSPRCPWVPKQVLQSNDTICPWDTRVDGSFYFHTSIAIPLSRITEAIRDIKLLRDTDPNSFCALDCYLGIGMRFFKKSEAYLGSMEDQAVVEFLYYRPRQLKVPRWNEHIMEELEQMLLQKYGGRPHFGKNRVYTLYGAAKKAGNLGKFLEVKKRLDPLGFFSSEWSDSVLGINAKAEKWGDGCALDGLCVCSEDRHCAPERGFLCRPGRVWTNARVCTQQ